MHHERPDLDRQDKQENCPRETPRRFQIEPLEERIAPIGGGGTPGGGWYNNPFLSGEAPGPH